MYGPRPSTYMLGDNIAMYNERITCKSNDQIQFNRIPCRNIACSCANGRRTAWYGGDGGGNQKVNQEYKSLFTSK